MNVFIDTEYTDALDLHLISLGLAADSGAIFYAEVPYPDAACSDFVRVVVIPLLGQNPTAQCTREELAARLTAWLESVRPDGEQIFICYDSHTDWDLFADVMDYRVPPWVRPLAVAHEIDDQIKYEWHRENELPEHHALHDALANQAAYRDSKPPDMAAGE